MAGSSELSEALNPNFFSTEHRPQSNISPTYNQHSRIPIQYPENNGQQLPVPPFTAHTSELADAINPAAISPNVVAKSTVSTKQARQSSADQVQLLKGLIQSIASYKAAVEQEKKRRVTWEQEELAKHLTRQTELENRVTELQRELDALKAEKVPPQLPTELIAQPSSPSPTAGHEVSHQPRESIMLFEPKSDETSQQEFVEGSSTSTHVSALSAKRRARSSTPYDMSEPEQTKPRTHRSSKPQTIQTAMRIHILRCMNLEHDKELPHSHSENTALPPTLPVRFIWDQTTKKSAHNAKMKTRIIEDLIANRELYPLVSTQEFTKGKLDGVFEQAYTTLRQKYVSQYGTKQNPNRSKERVDTKTRKARRASRKKIKLSNRLATRMTLNEYNSPAFNAAFQIECMSSEESSDGEDNTGDTSDAEKPHANGILKIRCLSWRSTRLEELFHVIDSFEEHDRLTKPKRGVGRKDRRIGRPKDGNPPPPQGIPRWMVSKKWLREASAINPQYVHLVVDLDQEVSPQVLTTLGDESEGEAGYSQQEPQQQHNFTQLASLPTSESSTLMNPSMYHQREPAQYLYPQQPMWTESMSYANMSQFSSPHMQAFLPGVSHPS